MRPLFCRVNREYCQQYCRKTDCFIHIEPLGLNVVMEYSIGKIFLPVDMCETFETRFAKNAFVFYINPEGVEYDICHD